jgi:hypothetical protein
MPTDRAQKFLATLERTRPIPTKEVEAIILRQGFPCFPPWLEFHERYAGYIEPIGRDTAVWGLIHRESHWHTPGEATIDHFEENDEWEIICAEVHPSYNYTLNQAGEFGDGRAISFDVKVERNALGASFSARGPSRYLQPADLADPALSERIRKWMPSALDKAASDKYRRYYADDRLLVREDAKTGELIDGWERL